MKRAAHAHILHVRIMVSVVCVYPIIEKMENYLAVFLIPRLKRRMTEVWPII